MAAGRFGALAAAGLFGVVVASMPASAQGLSEKAVKTFMDYAWSMTPAKFTNPEGVTVLIDKSKKDDVVVPLDKAREIIMAGRLTAHAQMCELPEAQVQNFHSLMRRERGSNKWSEQQMIYINQLHLTTVMLLTGKIQLVEKKDGKEIVVDESKAQVKSCTDEQRKQVTQRVLEYLKSEPKLENNKSAKQG